MEEAKFLNADASQEVIRGSRAIKNEALLAAIKEQFGYDYHNPPPSFPYETYLQMVNYLRQQLYPHQSEDEGYKALGRGIVEGHFQGAIGRVNRIIARIAKPRIGAEQFMRILQNNLPFGRHEIEEAQDNYMRYHQYGVPNPPALMQGILQAALEATGVKNVKVSSTIIEREDIIFEATWD